MSLSFCCSFVWHLCLFHGYLLSGAEQSSYACVYQIYNRSDIHLTVTTDSEIGTTLQTIFVNEIFRKRKKREVFPNDLVLRTNFSHFELVYEHYSKWNLIVADCLVAGITDTLVITLGGRVNIGQDCERQRVNITVDVQPTKPTIIAFGNMNINFSSCDQGGIIDVHQIDFFNFSTCARFKCLVECSNAAKRFWTDSGMVIQTFAGDIDFNINYQLLVACTDSGNSDMTPQYIDISEVNVTFEQYGSCTFPISATTRNMTSPGSASSLDKVGELSFHLLTAFSLSVGFSAE